MTSGEGAARMVAGQVVFRAAQVRAVVDAAAAAGSVISLVKDDGAYLMTWDADGQPAAVTYAPGCDPPPRSDDPGEAMNPDSAWTVARNHIEAIFGGDDFAVEYTVEEITDLLGPGRDRDVRVSTTLLAYPWPVDAPPLFSGLGEVFRLEDVVLEPVAP